MSSLSPGRSWPRSEVHAALLLCLLTGGLATLGLACRRPPPPPARDGAPNVVLVVVDTERADATSAGGHPTATPVLAMLSRMGITFRNAYTPGPWTVPAMYSLMTGLAPSAHGVVDSVIQKGKIVSQPVLSPQHVTLAEHLAKAGFATFGVNTNHHLAARFGMGQGFRHLVGEGFRELPEPNKSALAFKPQLANGKRPYFLWVHYFNPHHPYTPREPWFSRINRSGLTSEAEVGRLLDWQAMGYPSNALTVPSALAVEQRAGFNRFVSERLVGGDGPMRRGVQFLRDAYSSEISATDRAVGELLGQLPERKNTIVIYVSDHGEEFFEHGQLGHKQPGGVLFEQLLRVPFVIVLPRGERGGTVVETPVSLVDVLPTVIDLVQQPVPGGLAGRSLLPLLRGEAWPERVLISEVAEPDGTHYAAVDHPWKLVQHVGTEPELFNLRSDPGETHDLAASEPERVRIMRGQLAGYIAQTVPLHPPRPSAPLSEEELQRLEALGYIN